jgi:hypothetical protein
MTPKRIENPFTTTLQCGIIQPEYFKEALKINHGSRAAEKSSQVDGSPKELVKYVEKR